MTCIHIAFYQTFFDIHFLIAILFKHSLKYLIIAIITRRAIYSKLNILKGMQIILNNISICKCHNFRIILKSSASKSSEYDRLATLR